MPYSNQAGKCVDCGCEEVKKAVHASHVLHHAAFKGGTKPMKSEHTAPGTHNSNSAISKHNH